MSAIFQQISKRAKKLEADTARFLSDMVRVPSFSGKEKEVCQVIKKEMEAAGFDALPGSAWVLAIGHRLKDVEVPLLRISIPSAIDPVLEEVPR